MGSATRLGSLLLIILLCLTYSQIVSVRSTAISPTALSVSAPQFTARGTLDIIYSAGPKGAGETRYYLAIANGTRIKLTFAYRPHFAYFAKSVIVKGAIPSTTRLPNGRVESTMLVTNMTSGNAQGQQQLGSTYAAVTGTRRMIILLLKYSDDISVPNPPSFYSNLINPSTGNTVNAFYQSNSWGLFGVQADVTASWMTLPHAKSFYAPCGWSSVCADLSTLFSDGTALGSLNGVNFANYDMISLVLSNDLDCCAWGGSYTTTLSGVTKTWGTTWMPPWSQEAGTYSHEVGHSIGLPHSGWVYYDYDSPWDVMSDGNRYNPAVCGSYYSDNSAGTQSIYCYTPADTIAPFKDILGWIDAPHMLTVAAGGTATASIDSLAAPLSTAYKMVKICISGYPCTSGGATSRYLTVEVRTHYGYDQYLPGEGVIVHQFQGNRPTISGGCFFIADNPPAFPIDSTLGDFNSATCSGIGLNNAQWTVGQTYTDPSTLGQNQLKVVSQSGTSPSPATFTITVSPPTIPIIVTSGPTGSGFVMVDGTAITTPQTFNWPIASSHTLAANSPVSGTTGTQYVWMSWSDGGLQSHVIITPSTPSTFTANFKTQYQLTISTSPSAGGSTTPSVGSYWCDAGTSVSVSENAAGGYSFYYWSLDGTNVGSGPSFTVSMNSPHTLTALFRSTSSITLAAAPSSLSLGQSITLSGSISPAQSPGTVVMLSYSTDGGSTWNIFVTTTTDGTGSYSAVWYPPYPGSYQLRANWSGNTNYDGATSETASLTVTGSRPAQISLLVSGPSSASRGNTVTFDVLATSPGSGVTTTLFIELTGPSGYEYFDTLTVTLPATGSGRYQFAWQVPASISAGNYQVIVGTIPPTPTSIGQTQLLVT